MNKQVLLVDDDQDNLDFMIHALKGENYVVSSTISPTHALEYIKAEDFNVIVTDERMPDMSGTELMTRCKEINPNTLRIMLTGNATLESAVKAINSGGVYRYLMKPINSIELAVIVRQAMIQYELVDETRKLLTVSQKQSSYIRELKTSHPGILNFQTTDNGAIIIEEPKESDSIEALIKEINNEVEDIEILLKKHYPKK